MTTFAIADSAWTLDGADEELLEDLRALGVDVASPVTVDSFDQTRRDALASVLLRRQAEETEAIAQLERSCQAEIEFIKYRYGAERSKRADRARQLESAIQAIAYQTKVAGGYVGKKKSRDVGAGTYGYKTFAAGVELKDDAAYIAWAEQHAPESLSVKLKMTLSVAREYLSESELASVKREVMVTTAKATAAANVDGLPPGFVAVPESDDFYAKPLPAAAVGGANV
jgi:hypothetical protein